MKTYNILLGLLILTCSVIYPQNSDFQSVRYHNELRIGYFQLIKSGIFLSYERSYRNNGFVFSGELIYEELGTEKKIGYYGELQNRFYILDKSDFDLDNPLTNVGLYVAPAFFFKNIHLSNNSYDYDDEIMTYGGKLLMGLKIVVLERLTLDINFGAGIKASELESNHDNNAYKDHKFDLAYSGVLPIGNFTFGVKF